MVARGAEERRDCAGIGSADCRNESGEVDRLFDGKTQLSKALQPLMQAAEQTLELNQRKRQRTLVRFDAGGGSVGDVNWLLVRGYQIHGKDYSSARAGRWSYSSAGVITERLSRSPTRTPASHGRCSPRRRSSKALNRTPLVNCKR